MKKIVLTVTLALVTVNVFAQRQKHISLAVTNNNPAMPFNKFGGLFKTPFHPGFELGYGFNWRNKAKHDWFQTFKAGYFYHRFVQHGIPLYTSFGYRYKFSKTFAVDGSLAAGYMHSIPATGKFKLNEDGEYEKNKGVGRMQAIASLNLGLNYTFKQNSNKPITLFTIYQQRLQMPFIKSYVPLLPYNAIMLGVKIPMKSSPNASQK